MAIKYVRIYTDADGVSQFEELDMPFDTSAGGGRPAQPTEGMYFNRVPAGHDSGWHTAPRRQYVVHLAGVRQVTLRNGTQQRFGPGDVLLAEDLTGSGHHTKVVGDEDCVSLIVPVRD